MIRLTEMFNFADSSTYGKLKPQLGQVMSNPYARAFAPQVKEGEDHEVSMANNTLDAIIKNATELKSKIGGNEKNIPAWIQDHITNAGNFISQAAENYHEYGKNESKQQIKEATAKFDFVQANGVQFYVSSPNNNIVLLPQSRKEIEKIDTIKQKLGDGADEDFLSLLQIRLEKKLGVSVIPNKRYAGAGYAFDIDTEKLFNKL
jgi:hypothetical protein